MRDESADSRRAVDLGPDRSWVAEQLAATRTQGQGRTQGRARTRTRTPARTRTRTPTDPEPRSDAPATPASPTSPVTPAAPTSPVTSTSPTSPASPASARVEALSSAARDAAAAVAVAWNGPYGADLRLAARAAAHAALAAIATWLVAVTLCVTVWLASAPDAAGFSGPLRVAGQLWLLGHHAPLDVPAGRIALAPLGFTALPVLALWLTAVAPVARPAQIAYTAFGAATGYCLVAALVASGAATGDVRPDTAQAVLFAVLFGALVPTAARWRRIVGFCVLPDWTATAARAVVAGTAVALGGGAAVLAGALVAHLPEPGWPRGVLDAAGMFLLALAVLPNAVVWATSFVLGPGFAVGTGTGVSVLSAKVGPLPNFPLLGAVPVNGSRLQPAALAFLLIPVAAGVAVALAVRRSGRHRLGDQVRATAAATVALAGILGLAATLSDGPLAGGRMTAFGPSGWRTAAATLLFVGVTAAAVILVPPSALAVRRLTVRGLAGLAVRRLSRLARLPRLPRLAGLTVRRLLDAVAELRPRRRTEVGPGLALPDEDDREQAGEQHDEGEDLADRGDVVVAEVAQSAQDTDAEEDAGDDARVVVAATDGEGHPEPQAGLDQSDDDDGGDEDALVVVDGVLGVPEGDEVIADLAQLGQPDDDADQLDAQAGEHHVRGELH